jgi:hypothetical protein
MASTQEVWDHHVEGFVARDLSMVLEDYDENSLLIANGKIFRGLEGVRTFYSGLFTELPENCAFELTECIVLDSNVYIVWNAESESVIYDFATDTFNIEDGKFTLQTMGFVKHEKT